MGVEREVVLSRGMPPWSAVVAVISQGGRLLIRKP